MAAVQLDSEQPWGHGGSWRDQRPSDLPRSPRSSQKCREQKEKKPKLYFCARPAIMPHPQGSPGRLRQLPCPSTERLVAGTCSPAHGPVPPPRGPGAHLTSWKEVCSLFPTPARLGAVLAASSDATVTLACQGFLCRCKVTKLLPGSVPSL